MATRPRRVTLGTAPINVVGDTQDSTAVSALLLRNRSGVTVEWVDGSGAATGTGVEVLDGEDLEFARLEPGEQVWMVAAQEDVEVQVGETSVA